MLEAGCPMRISFFRRRKVAPCRQHPYRPALESLEDRLLLANDFLQINLASDLPGLAANINPQLVNPWGLSYSPTGPFWIADQGTGTGTVLDGEANVIPLLTTIPAARPTDH